MKNLQNLMPTWTIYCERYITLLLMRNKHIYRTEKLPSIILPSNIKPVTRIFFCRTLWNRFYKSSTGFEMVFGLWLYNSPVQLWWSQEGTQAWRLAGMEYRNYQARNFMRDQMKAGHVRFLLSQQLQGTRNCWDYWGRWSKKKVKTFRHC